MEEAGLVVLTETGLDYALAAAVRRKLATALSVPACYPLLAPDGLAPEQDSFLRRHGVSARRLSELVEGTDPAARSRTLARSLAWTGAPIGVRSDAPVSAVLRALLQSGADDRAVLLDDSAPGPEPSPRLLAAGDPQRLVVARAGSAAALPAAVYAEATGKRFVAVDSLGEAEARLARLRPASVILADDLDRFPKERLARLLAWSAQGPLAPVLLGIMAGQSAAQTSAVVCRLMVHRDFRQRGGRLFEPSLPEPVAVQDMQPMEFYVVTAHGNEMHLRHNQDEVLCGAFANRPREAKSFDCEPRCPHSKRVRASAVPAHAVFLLSCDAFTLGDGLVPPEFNVLLNFLNGWAGTVLAPFKHVQGNVGLRILTNALIHSGHSIGEIAQRLNGVARFDDVPDYSYLVLGDPDLVAKADAQPSRAPVADLRSSDALDVACDAKGAYAVEVTIPAGVVGEILGTEEANLALEPRSETLHRPDIYFALRWLPGREALGVVIFSNEALPEGPLIFRLGAARRLDEHEQRTALDRLGRLNALASLSFLAPAVRAIEGQILSILRTAAAYPRAVELVQGHAIVRAIGPIMANEYRGARRGILQAVLDEMASARVWISQSYAAAYPLVRQAAPAEACPHCGSGLTAWSYQDGGTGLPERIVAVCNRCGIIEDRPAAGELEITLATCRSLGARTLRQDVSLCNRSARAIELTLLHQFNQWRQLGIEADPAIAELTLAAGERVERSVLFRFPADLHDDVQQMQFFALTDRFDLHFAGQKVTSTIRANEGIEADRSAQLRERSVRAG